MNECVRAGRWVRAAAAVAGAAFVLAACGATGASSAQLDARFVAAVRADGRDVREEADQQTELVTAARKICARRRGQADLDARHRSALTPRELDAVAKTFAGDARRFAALALDTYCPS
jgi:Protein of unknown function (DUF732)